MADRAVIFDMDGVLVDSYQAHFESWNRMLGPRGLAMSEERFAATFGRTSREILLQQWPGEVGERDVAAMDAEKEAAYREVIRERFPEMPGAGELIAALHEAGFAMAIGSSGPPENVRAVLNCLPHADLIAATADGRQVARGKPDPEVFLLAAEKLGLPPGRAAVIEDAPVGIEAARRAGMTAIALTGTAPREALGDADLIVEALAEITPERIAELIDAR